ncbi:corepressor complex CRC230 [Toxoplasma gondii FOU]|uniref:Corepressor complex CRC230 n=1 Tax=Toxoplasma gondii FOU TaxID=943167 RepID=A0A086KLJ9_TOXGO|nr:corepressor complex CRC230 [Toxoplasma gondii FOU]
MLADRTACLKKPLPLPRKTFLFRSRCLGWTAAGASPMLTATTFSCVKKKKTSTFCDSPPLRSTPRTRKASSSSTLHSLRASQKLHAHRPLTSPALAPDAW